MSFWDINIVKKCTSTANEFLLHRYTSNEKYTSPANEFLLHRYSEKMHTCLANEFLGHTLNQVFSIGFCYCTFNKTFLLGTTEMYVQVLPIGFRHSTFNKTSHHIESIGTQSSPTTLGLRSVSVMAL